jgi:hypothetical protein
MAGLTWPIFNAACDDSLRDIECGGDVGYGFALVYQVPEGLELIGRMHILGDRILGEVASVTLASSTVWQGTARSALIAWAFASHARVVSRLLPATTAKYFSVLIADERLQPAVRRDRGGQSADAVFGSDALGVAFPGDQLAEKKNEMSKKLLSYEKRL